MIAQELEVSLHMAFVEARQKRHEFITVEHLLLALLDNPTAAEVPSTPSSFVSRRAVEMFAVRNVERFRITQWPTTWAALSSASRS